MILLVLTCILSLYCMAGVSLGVSGATTRDPRVVFHQSPDSKSPSKLIARTKWKNSPLHSMSLLVADGHRDEPNHAPEVISSRRPKGIPHAKPPLRTSAVGLSTVPKPLENAFIPNGRHTIPKSPPPVGAATFRTQDSNNRGVDNIMASRDKLTLAKSHSKFPYSNEDKRIGKDGIGFKFLEYPKLRTMEYIEETIMGKAKDQGS